MKKWIFITILVCLYVAGCEKKGQSQYVTSLRKVVHHTADGVEIAIGDVVKASDLECGGWYHYGEVIDVGSLCLVVGTKTSSSARMYNRYTFELIKKAEKK